jgi:hypothetical protein
MAMPVEAIHEGGPTTVGFELRGVDGRVHAFDAQIDPDSPITFADEDPTPVLGPAGRYTPQLYEAVRAFWRSTGPGLEYAEVAQPGVRPQLAALRSVGPLTYELTFADATPTVRVDVDVLGRLAYVAPALPDEVDTALLAAAVAAMHRARTRGDGEEVLPVPVRSVAEAGAYLTVALIGREGVIDFGREVVVRSTDSGDRYVRFHGDYGGRSLVVPVYVTPGLDPSAPADRYLSHGIGVSAVLDAGQWLILELMYSVSADDHYAALEGDDPDDETYDTVLQELRLADAAGEEVAKFLSVDEGTIPDLGFWSARGRAERVRGPELFARRLVDQARRDNRRRLDEFIARHGPDAVPADLGRASPETT